MADTKKEKRGNKKGNNLLLIALAPLFLVALVVIGVPVTFCIKNGESLLHAIPYAMLFTGFRAYNEAAWGIFGTPLDLTVQNEPEPLPVILAKDYTYEKLREVTHNFHIPAVVKGLFKDQPAIEKWHQPGYLKSKLGKFEIPVIRNAKYGLAQNNKTNERFAAAIDDIIGEDSQTSYLFFPMKNRPTKNHYGSQNSEFDELTETTDKLMLDDLHIHEVIRPGFGTKSEKRYLGGQFVIGKGTNDTQTTTGSGWHCAMGSNFFVQVHGIKRWYFMHPEKSYLFKPLRIGMVAFMASVRDLGSKYKSLPIRHADLEPGDMLYNPSYQWHTIMNFEGLTIGVPIRELSIPNTIRENLLFSSVAASNKLWEYFGINLGGFPPELGDKPRHDD